MLEIVEYLKARLHTNERGAAAVEYALLIGLIAAVIFTAVTGLATKITSTFGDVVTKI
jgi:Flp pilus assembly pilin Flp